MRDIKGYEGLYAVTSCGKVWSYRAKKFLKPAYPSLIAAGASTGILRTSISNYLRGKSKTAGGYHWEYC